MDINKIKFVPKANAFSDVYAKATGVPFVGEMMVAAAGNGGDEPTPPTPSVVESVTVSGRQYSFDVDFYENVATVTFNQDFVSEYCDPTHFNTPAFVVTIKDSNDTTIFESYGSIYYCETNVVESIFSGEGTLPTLPESGNYSIVVSNLEGTIYEGTGTWTYEAPQFQLTVKVVKISEYTFEMDVTSNMLAPVENASIYIFDEPALDGCVGDYTSAFEGHFVPSSEYPTVWYSDDYSCDGSGIGDECGFTYIAQADWIDGSVYVENTEQTYDHAISGTWTYEDQTI